MGVSPETRFMTLLEENLGQLIIVREAVDWILLREEMIWDLGDNPQT